MSADAEMVQRLREAELARRFEWGDDDLATLLADSADTIAALGKDAERLDWLDKHPREATIRVGTDMKACVFYGVSCDPKWTMREAIDAAIDAAQSTEGSQ